MRNDSTEINIIHKLKKVLKFIEIRPAVSEKSSENQNDFLLFDAAEKQRKIRKSNYFIALNDILIASLLLNFRSVYYYKSLKRTKFSRGIRYVMIWCPANR